jgi:death-on-curing protein
VKTPVWLDRDDCLAIHEMMLSQHGGLAGVRDEGMLASALAKPQNRFAYQSSSLSVLAASYAAGIVLNHPFIDGKKRTGFMAAVTFLAVNGMDFNATEQSVVKQTLALAAGELTERDYAAWLKAHSKRVESGHGTV